MRITICNALPKDAYEYTACHISCWQSAYKGIIPDEYLNSIQKEQEQRTERCRQSLIAPADREFYCVMYADKMIGCLIISKSRDEDKPNAGEINAIYLIKEFWNKGYGGEMLDFAIDKLKYMGYNEIFLWVLEENDRARRFYAKHNFIYDGTKKEIEIGKPLIEIRYVLNL